MHTLQVMVLCVLMASLCVQSAPQSESVKRFLDVVKQQRRSAELATGEEVERRQTGTKGSNTGGGVVYIRWGRTECAGDATVLYTGQVGGAHYTHAGSGANYLCLHERPQWANTETSQSGGQIWGAEYELGGISAFSLANNGGNTLQNHDVPCVVCYAATREAKVMIPGRRECPDSWTSEYRGYLVSAHVSHQKGMFECMDETPEVMSGGHADHNGALFYSVDAICGSLQCPRYTHARKVTCVLCTK